MSLVHREKARSDEVALLRRSATFPPELSTPGAARRLLAEALGAAGREQWADSASLALSEVVTNAALHAHTWIEVALEVYDDHVWVEVTDGSPGLPQQRSYDEQATTGRGMSLVAALTDECGVYGLGPAGKVIWFRLGDAAETSAEDLLAVWDLDADDDIGLTTDGLDAPQPVTTALVVLEHMPITLWLAARKHHDALLRELVLYMAEHDDVRLDLAQADLARNLVMDTVLRVVDRAQQDGTALPAVPSGHPAPLPAVPLGPSVTVEVPPELGPGYAALQDALDVAERLAAAGQLLARPGLPEVVAVRDWVCEQVVAQLAGQAPLAWGGTAQLHFETTVNASSHPSTWDDTIVREADRGAVAADEANRIIAVSRPLAALLGWEVDDLVGRRVVTLIPPALREAHVAGFTRHLTTGEGHILGVGLTLPVLRADGTELRCTFQVEQSPIGGGRSVYLAWIEPAPEG